MRDDRLRLEDIRDAIENIQKYSRRGRKAYDEDELVRVWILHHLEIMVKLAGGCRRVFE